MQGKGIFLPTHPPLFLGGAGGGEGQGGGLEWYTETTSPACLCTNEDWKLVLILNAKLEFSYKLPASRR